MKDGKLRTMWLLVISKKLEIDSPYFELIVHEIECWRFENVLRGDVTWWIGGLEQVKITHKFQVWVKKEYWKD